MNKNARQKTQKSATITFFVVRPILMNPCAFKQEFQKLPLVRDETQPIFKKFQNFQIDWSNIDPQHYDTFAISDAKLYTSYGTKYAYDSIMHYNAYLGAKDPNKPTMIPLVNPQENTPKLGQRAKLTRGDIRLLKKMYCRPGCDDQNVHCGTWALHGYCKMKEQMKWMNENCKASCDKC